MKPLNMLKTLALLVIAVIGVNFAYAATSYVPSTPPQTGPAAFLDISATNQAKQGWLALGSTPGYNPLAVLDVNGTAIANVLGVLGNSWITGKMRIGGTSAPSATDPSLVVDNSRIRSTILATGGAEQQVCADSNGLLKLCGTSGAVGACGTSLPQAGVASLTATSSGLCDTGTATGFASNVGGGAGWHWSCVGPGGTSSMCMEPALPNGSGIAGQCGSLNNSSVPSGSILTSTTPGLCSVGTLQPMSLSGTPTGWEWNCLGTGTGAMASCMATTSVNGVCAYSTDGVNPPTPLCSSGTPFDLTYSSLASSSNTLPANASWPYNVTWQCAGSNGGQNDVGGDASVNAGYGVHPCDLTNVCPQNWAPTTGCFLPGTQISLADGSKKSIEDVKTGESVKTVGNQDTPVTKTISHIYNGWVYGINGSNPFVTADHPFMTTEGWKSFDPSLTAKSEPSLANVGTLKKGDQLLKEDGSKETLQSFTKIWMNTRVYNFTVQDTHQYYANGYEVHNLSNTVGPSYTYCAGPSNNTPAPAVSSGGNVCGTVMNGGSGQGNIGGCNLGATYVPGSLNSTTCSSIWGSGGGNNNGAISSWKCSTPQGNVSCDNYMCAP